MELETHKQAFEERKETIFKWALEVRGLENSQHIVGDNASRAITELLSAYLHQQKKVEVGYQLNHAWFKSEKVRERLPEFNSKEEIVSQMIYLEILCEKLSYGSPKPLVMTEEVINLFKSLEKKLKELLLWN
ncbi:hypothetical protein J4437_03355 [Candidatus Woesearchaeota archaeon]|nr:hypothetical protein [Candidatus Woesearchaeota archaeon]